MKRSRKIALGVAASLGVAMAVAAVFAQPFGMGPGMMHGMDHGAAAGGHGPMAGATAMLTKQDAKVVAALQGHAAEVTELAQEGPVAMMRGMMSRMAMGPRGPQAGTGPGAASGSRVPAGTEHSH